MSFAFKARFVLLSICLFLGAGLPLTLQFARHADRPLTEIDEAAWYFDTYYYHLAFQRAGRRHPDWQDAEAFDHPPLGKWILGAFVARHAPVCATLERRRDWTRRAYDTYQYLSFREEMQRRVPPPALRAMRTASFLFALGAVLAMFFLGYLFHPAAGLLAAVLLAWNPVVREEAVTARVDIQALFWITLALCLQFWVLRRALSERRFDQPAIFGMAMLSVILALGLLTKLNVLVVWIVWLCNCIAAACMSRARIQRRGWLIAAFGVLAVAWGFVVAGNPALWPRPLANTVEMISHPLTLKTIQKNAFINLAFDGWSNRLSNFLQQLFFSQSAFFATVRLPVESAFLLIGVLLLLREQGRNTAPFFRLTVLSAAVLGALTYGTFMLNWGRYTLPFVPLVLLMVSFGIVRTLWPALESVAAWRQFHRALRPQWFFALGGTALIWLLSQGPLRLPVQSADELSLMIRWHENALAYHPKDKTVKATLAILYEQSGNEERAAAFWKDVFAHDPQEEPLPLTRAQLEFFERAAADRPLSKPRQDWLANARHCFSLARLHEDLRIRGEPHFLVACPYFVNPVATVETLQTELKRLREEGWNAIRVPVRNLDELDALRRLCAAVDATGLTLGLLLSRRDWPDAASHMEAAEILAVETRDFHNVYLDLAYERNARDLRFVAIAELREMRDQVRKRDPYRKVSATHLGNLSEWDLRDYAEIAKLDFLTVAPAAEAETARSLLRQWRSQMRTRIPIVLLLPQESAHFLSMAREWDAAGAAGVALAEDPSAISAP